MNKGISRRNFLKATGAAAGALAFGSRHSLLSAAAQSGSISFWTQPYGDLIAYQNMMDGLATRFTEESGIQVNIDVINWGQAFDTWRLVSQGGDHPATADMFWLYTHSAIGGEEFGPRPINEFREQYFPDLEERFFEATLADVTWRGDFYGIPWRGDIRPMIYRTDAFEEVGLTAAPDNWDEITEMARELTIRDNNSNVQRWGFALGHSNVVQNIMPYYWAAGGEFMTEDGITATIDNEAMRETLRWMYDLLWTHEVISPEFMESSYNAEGDFQSGLVAMIGSAADNVISPLARDFPELDGLWTAALPPAGPERRVAYSGAGYWGVLRGAPDVENSVRWIEFLSRDENMLEISTFTGGVSPNRSVMASDFWTDAEWKRVVVESLNYAYTSQHASPAWAVISAAEPGGVIYDLFNAVLIRQEDMDEAIATAQERMQAEMDSVALNAG